VFQAYPIPIAVAVAAAAIAAVTDVTRFKVYNLLTFPLLAAGLLYHGLTAGGPGLAASFLGAAAGFFMMILLYVMGGMGAGDVKFVTALGAWLGLPLTLYVFLAGCVAAGLYSIVLIVAADSMKEVMLNMQVLMLKLHSLGRHLGAEDRVADEVVRPDRYRRLVPFSAMVAVGLVATLTWAYFQSGELLHESLPNSAVSNSHVGSPIMGQAQPTLDIRR
jgi:prepilin peptidase CpaA